MNQSESDGWFGKNRSPGTTSTPNERTREVERPPKSKDSSRIFKQTIEEEPSPQDSFEVEAARELDKPSAPPKRKRTFRTSDANAYQSVNDRLQNDFDPSSDSLVSMTPKTYHSNSFNQPEAEANEAAEDTDFRAQGSMKGVSRVLNAARFVFRDSKSKSISQKTSRSANVKLNPGPATASVKKLLQSSILKAGLAAPAPPNSVVKSFEDVPTIKTPLLSSAREERTPPTDQSLSFKKPAKDSIFSRVGKSVGPGLGLAYHNPSPEDRGGTGRGE